jgi:hypothetical protein
MLSTTALNINIHLIAFNELIENKHIDEIYNQLSQNSSVTFHTTSYSSKNIMGFQHLQRGESE